LKNNNITAVKSKITYNDRVQKSSHKGGILWFTGLSSSGKSTLADELQTQLFNKNYNVYVLDGDNIRGGISNNLSFSEADRSENCRRVAEIAKLFAEAGFIVIAALISPYEKDRVKVARITSDFFHLVHIKASLETCEKRDVKGLYKKARNGEISNFTGIDSIYEEPKNPDVTINTERLSAPNSIKELMNYVSDNF